MASQRQSPLPTSILASWLDKPNTQQRSTRYNLSDWYHVTQANLSLRVRLCHPPGRFPQGPSRGLHNVQRRLEPRLKRFIDHPNIGAMCFATIDGSTDPATSQPTVAVVSPFYSAPIMDHRRLTEGQKTKWMAEICEAVGHLHKNGIVHGNIHPRNIFILEGRAILTDACLYDLTARHIMSGLDEECQYEIQHPETLACKSSSAIRGFQPAFPKDLPTQQDDIFALAITLCMISNGEELWKFLTPTQKIIKIERCGHRHLEKPDAMTEDVWQAIQAVIYEGSPATPTIQDIIQLLRGF
ncbi:hypothetical protein AN958_12464 [Leucoagaricus sp. SymC.cos]|nr:hypothetical protein AN958_12464 [Leucoagaricus sp. SymC.cos]